MAKYTQKDAADTFRAIFDQSSDLLYINTIDGILMDVNQAVVEKYGYSKEEMIGQSPLMFAAPGMNDTEAIQEIIDKTFAEGPGPTPPIEWWSVRKDGTLFLKEIILRQGKYFGEDVIVVNGRDITQRKKNEEELLRKTEQLRILNRELDSFMWKVSHDLKAPLSSIKGIVHVAKIEKDRGNTKEYFEHIENSIEKLNVFIKGMEDITRNKQREVNYAPVDFEVLVDSVMDDFQFNNLTEGVQITKKIDQNSDFGSDSLILQSVLHNLVSNSYKYKADSQPEITILVDAGEEEGVITVEDNGIGIRKEFLPKVFDMFFRASDKSEGSGLGLFIVKEALQKINGSIDVQSQEGIGTKFILKIPNSISEIQN